MGFILFIHIVACILLVITILMQAGRGGGLAESFASAESMFGTQTNKFMVRLSTILAIIFFSTSLILAINATKGNKSLMEKAKLPLTNSEMTKTEEPTVTVSEPKPMADINEAQVKEAVEKVIANTVQ